MLTGKLEFIVKTISLRSSSTSTDSCSDCNKNTKSEELSANIHTDHQPWEPASYADALRGPQSPKAESLAGDFENEPRSPKTAPLSKDANDERQSLQPPEQPADAIPPCLPQHQPDRLHINPWIATLQYRVSTLISSIEVAQANTLPFRNHVDLGEPLPFVMDWEFAALLVRSNMLLVAEWIRELKDRGLTEYPGLENIIAQLIYFWRHWHVRQHDPQLMWRIQCLVSFLVG